MRRLFGLILLCNASLFAYEDYGNDCYPKSTFLSRPAFANEPREEGYNAPARFDVRRCFGLYLWGSYLYWQPRQDGMEVGFSQTITGSFANFTANNLLLNLDWPYKTGFKVGFGIHTSLDDWDLSAEYTWFHMTHQRSFNQFPIFVNWFALNTSPLQGGTFQNEFSSLEADWKVHLDMGDVELGRASYVGTNLILRPHLGGRILWLEQSYLQSGNEVFLDSILTMDSKSRCFAVGPRVGVGADFVFGGRCLRFFGNANASLLYSRYHVHYASPTIPTDPFGGATNITATNTISTVRANADVGAGFALGFYVGHHNFHIDISASYDFQVFFNQNMMAPLAFITSEPNIGNLYIQGLTATLRLDF